MDISETIAPRSDQTNAEDFLTGPRTVTVEKVTKGSAEQPVDIHLVEFPGRPFRPSKTVRRILVAAWGAEAANYVGRRMTLYRDPAVKFGGAEVGGIRVSHLSHIDKPLSLMLTATRGKRTPHVIQPLPDTPAPKSDAVAPEQLKRIGALMGDLGIARDTAAETVADIIGRPIESAHDLTRDEAAQVIDHLARLLGEVPPSEEQP